MSITRKSGKTPKPSTGASISGIHRNPPTVVLPTVSVASPSPAPAPGPAPSPSPSPSPSPAPAPTPAPSAPAGPNITNIVSHPVDWLKIGNYFTNDGRQLPNSRNTSIDPNLTEGTGVDQFEEYIERSLVVNPEDGSVAARWKMRWPHYNSLGHSIDPLEYSGTTGGSAYGYNEVKSYPSFIFGKKPGYSGLDMFPAYTVAIRNPDGAVEPVPKPSWTPSNIASQWQPLGGSADQTSPCGASPNSSVLPITTSALKTARLRGKIQENITPTGRGHLSFDMFLTADPTQGTHFVDAPISHEIMIPIRFWGGYGKYGNRSPSWYSHDVTIDGVLYHVYAAADLGRSDVTLNATGSFPGVRYNFQGLNPNYTNEETGQPRIGWKFIVFEFDAPNGTGLSGAAGQLDYATHPLDADGYFNIDYTKFLDHLMNSPLCKDSRGIQWVTGTKYVPAIEFGIEPVWGECDYTIYNYSNQMSATVDAALPKPAGNNK